MRERERGGESGREGGENGEEEEKVVKERDEFYLMHYFSHSGAAINCYSNEACTNKLNVPVQSFMECCVNTLNALSFDTSGENCSNCVGRFMT